MRREIKHLKSQQTMLKVSYDLLSSGENAGWLLWPLIRVDMEGKTERVLA